MLVEPPNDPHLERGLLGAIITYGPHADIYGTASEILTGDEFYNPTNAAIWHTIAQLHFLGEPIDAVTIAAETETVDVVYLADLVTATTASGNAARYARRLHALWERRQTLTHARRLADAANEGEDPGAVLTSLEAVLGERPEGTVRTARTMVEEALDRWESLASGATPPKFQTGWVDYDDLVQGWTNDLHIIAGRPGMGKTAAGTSIAVNALDRGGSVFWASLEMSAAQVVDRLVNTRAGLGGRTPGQSPGSWNAGDWAKANDAAGWLGEQRLIVDDNRSSTLDGLIKQARRAARGYGGLDLVIIDYIQLLSAGHGVDKKRHEFLGEVSRSFAGLAQELGCPVLCLAQLNRGTDQRIDKRPQSSDLRESGDLEQNAATVSLLFREGFYDGQTSGQVEIIVAKNRFGKTGSVYLLWHGPDTSFSPLYRGGASEY